jgi:hypothetical protein
MILLRFQIFIPQRLGSLVRAIVTPAGRIEDVFEFIGKSWSRSNIMNNIH